jgi:hypothetical protein
MADEPFFYTRIRREYTECSSWRQQALKYVASIHPDAVVLSTSADYEFSQEQWLEGAARMLGALSAQVGKIYLLRSTPRPGFDGPSCLAAYAQRPLWLGHAPHCQAVIGSDYDFQVYALLSRVAAKYSNVQTIDMNDAICPNQLCRAELHDQVVFRDSQHLTASFARFLSPEMLRRLAL